MSVPRNIVGIPGGKGFPNLESILGPQLVGTILSTALWGVAAVQTYDYFITSNQDHRQKWIVTLLWILNTLDSIMVSHILYDTLVTNYGNSDSLSKPLWTLLCRPLVNTIISFIVRTMFARRIYLVSRKNVTLTLWIMAVSTAALVAGSLVTAKTFLGVKSNILLSFKTVAFLSFFLGIASDISVTISLFWLLYSVKTGIPKTDSLVKTLMVYVVTTGLLVVIDFCLAIIFFAVMPDSLVFYIFYMLFPKLYISTYLASLNGRKKLRNNQTDIAISFSRMSYRKSPTTADDGQVSDNEKPIILQSPSGDTTDSQEVKNSNSAE